MNNIDDNAEATKHKSDSEECKHRRKKTRNIGFDRIIVAVSDSCDDDDTKVPTEEQASG